MKKCELCNSPAKIYCESDQAYLCWNCDTKVHGANFLVAKHLRTLLCHLCQSPTPWNGCGPKLGPTLSVCNICVGNNSHTEMGNNGETRNDVYGHDHLDREDDDDEDNDDVEEDNDDGDDEDDDEENQVVPWSSTPAPAVSSSSTVEECSSKFCTGEEGISEYNITFSKKRMRETTNFHSQDHQGHSSPQRNKNAYM